MKNKTQKTDEAGNLHKPPVSGSSPLSEDTINKMDCLLGYLYLWLREKDTSLTMPDELELVIKEADEWLLAQKKVANFH